MITETGWVKKVLNGKAQIEIERGTACSKCHASSMCHVEKQMMIVEAADPIGVHPNQRVQIAIPTESVLLASFVVYMIPLMALILGTLLGQYLGKLWGIRHVMEILGGFGCLGASFIVIRCYNTIFKHNINNQPVITKVIG